MQRKQRVFSQEGIYAILIKIKFLKIKEVLLFGSTILEREISVSLKVLLTFLRSEMVKRIKKGNLMKIIDGAEFCISCWKTQEKQLFASGEGVLAS